MKENLYSVTRSLPRMSWNPKNLYNLHERSLGGKATEINFKTTSKTVYQQRWLSKQLARGYHGDFLPEGSFQRHYLPASLPALIEKQDTDAMRHRKERTPVPVGSLMFAKLESRLDVLVFRACLAPSVYRARQMVIHRKVTVDGDLVTNPNLRLEPGQMFTVDPRAIDMLRMYSRDRVGPAYKPAMRKGKEAENAAAPTTPDAAPVEEAAADSSAEPAASEEASAGAEAEASTPETPAKRPDPFDLRASPKSRKAELDFVLPDYAAPFIFVPPYLEVHYPTASAVYVRAPTAGPGFSEVPTPWEADGDIVRMTWEWYNKVGPRRKERTKRDKIPSGRPVDESHIYKGL